MQVPCRDWKTGIKESTSAPTITTSSDDRYGKYHAVPQRVPTRSGGGELVDRGPVLTSELENLQALLIATACLRCNWAMGNRVCASNCRWRTWPRRATPLSAISPRSLERRSPLRTTDDSPSDSDFREIADNPHARRQSARTRGCIRPRAVSGPVCSPVSESHSRFLCLVAVQWRLISVRIRNQAARQIVQLPGPPQPN